MPLFNNRYGINSFFNDSIFPKLKDTKGRSKFDDDLIFDNSQNILNGLLNGVVNGDNIEVQNMPETRLSAIIKASTPLIEAISDNIDKIQSGISQNTKVYVSIGNISQGLNEPEKKLKLLNEIIENIKYSPDFGNEPSAQQNQWIRKVGFKDEQSRIKRRYN